VFRLITILLLLPTLLLAQHKPENHIEFFREYTPYTKTYFSVGALSEVNAAMVQVFLQNYQELNLGRSSLLLLDSVKSPGGWHFNYRQQYNGVDVFGAGVKINVGNNGRIRSIVDNTVELSLAINTQFPPDEYAEGETNMLSYARVYFYNGMQLIPSLRLEIRETDLIHYEIIYDIKKEVLYYQDLNRYLMSDSIVTAKIFLPDPLTTAGKIYGGVYADNGDADIVELNNERFDVMMIVDYTDSFRLTSSFVEIQEFSNPKTVRAVSATPEFSYSRSQKEFEDVNGFYHLSTFQNYMQSLGFSLVNYQVGVDVHALNGADNSMFSFPKLYFGDGCVDDAEDADVIIHEYGHAITASAAPNTWVGSERKALDEAAGDYLATSYTRSLNPFNWEFMFGWDGNSAECWSGRTAATTKHYPEDITGDIHQDGEIWNAAIMQIWEVLGRETTDQIFLQSLYSYAQGISMADAAYMFLDADSLLNGGANYITCYYWLEKRGFLPPLPFYSGTDGNGEMASCYGFCDAIAIAVPIGGVPPYAYAWKDSLGTPLSQTSDTVTGLCAGSYSVLITDSVGDTVTVNVQARQPNPLQANIVVVDESCALCNDGVATALASGGTPPYTYQWNDLSSQSNKFATGLDSGYHSISIVDANGCTLVDSGLVGVGSPINFGVAIASSTAPLCNAQCNGSILSIAFGGLSPYAYAWSDGLFQTTSEATNLCAGAYTVTVTDSNGDTVVQSVSLPDPLMITSTTVAVDDSGNGNGTITVTVNNANPPLTYTWNDGQAQTTATATGLLAGAYSVSWIDANGCTGSVSDTVGLFTGILDRSFGKVSVFPNPTDGMLYVTSDLLPDHLYIQINNLLGQSVHSDYLSADRQLNLSAFPAGLYYIVITYDQVMLHHEKLLLY